MSTDSDFHFKEGTNVFTPKDLVELAEPGLGVANPAGDLVLVPVRQYSAKEGRPRLSIHVISIEAAVSPLEIPLENGGDAFWLDSRTIAHAVEDSGERVTALYALSVKLDTGLSSPSLSGSPSLIGKFPTSTASNFRHSSKAGFLVFSDEVYGDEDITAVKKNDEAWENRGHSAYVYDSSFARHWDSLVGPKKSSLFSVHLAQSADKTWVLGSDYTNLLKGTGHHSPVVPFGGIDHFDISEARVVYTAKDPALPPAAHTKQNVYIVDKKEGKLRELTLGPHGAISNPIFSHQGDKVAWLEMAKDGYESDKNNIVIYDLVENIKFTLTEHWDRSPLTLAFSDDGRAIYFTARDQARVKIFVLPVPPTPSSTNRTFSSGLSTPFPLTSSGTAAGIQILSNGRLLFTSSSFTSPNNVYVMRGLECLDLYSAASRDTFKPQIDQLTSFSEESLKGKRLDAGEEFWFESTDGRQVQGWIVKPPGFKSGEIAKWPVVLMIHGGPQTAWSDQWGTVTQWNPNLFAHQGYVTILINPAGSPGFGQDFTDLVCGDWGGKPIIDLQRGWAYILDKYPEIDRERAAGAGASWSGFAINYIHGHPELGFGFKVLLCQSGIFSAAYFGYATDELFFFNHEWSGRPWESKAKELLAKYDPANFVDKWSIPTLIIHGSKDYRVPETEGIAAFHTLQQLGVPSRLVIFPDETHALFNHKNGLKLYYEVFRWFDRYLN